MADDDIDSDIYGTREALSAAGLDLEVQADLATVGFDGRRFPRRLVWLPRLTSTRHRSGLDEVPQDALIIGQRVPPRLAEQLRDGGGWYADTVGNAYIRAPGILVDVRGRALKQSSGIVNTRYAPGSPTNLMSARRAQVIFCLLTWPAIINAPLRYIAQVSGVSLSVVHSVLAALEDGRYLSPDRQLLYGRDELIDQWTSAFALGVGRSIELGRFKGEPSPSAWVAAGHHVLVGGELVASGLRGLGMTLYVTGIDERAIVRSHWRRPDEASGEIANIMTEAKILARTRRLG